MRKKYSVKELASLLGCSITAVNKKIKVDVYNPVLKRYKGRYDIIEENGIKYILLDDAELEEEKNLSQGFRNVANNGCETVTERVVTQQNQGIARNNTNSSNSEVFEFTERYIERVEKLQATFYNELQQRDKQILLLTTSESQKETEYLETTALNKTLKESNKRLTVVLTVVSTLCITVVIYALILTFGIEKKITVSQPINNGVETVIKETVRNYLQ